MTLRSQSQLTEPEDGLEVAARALDGELRRTTRFRLVSGRCFDRAAIDSPVHEHLAAELALAGARFTGDYELKEIPRTVLRLGEVDGGRAVALVVSPPDREPYVELTTWFSDGTAQTCNGRTGQLPERPDELLLLNRPGMAPADLLEVHRQEVAGCERSGRATVEVLRGLSGPFAAVARYLDALGF